jgi:peroxiredoxin
LKGVIPMKITILPVILSLAGLSAVLMGAKSAPFGGPRAPADKSLKVGDRAPDFALPFATAEKIGDKPWRLSEQLGDQRVVLAFYPADFSPGCTKEMCTFRDNFQALAGMNAKVVGISGDYVWAHQAWAKSEQLPFALLSDHAHDVGRLYGSYDEKSGYNRRTVFVIDGKGIIRYLDLAYSVSDEADYDALRAALKQAGAK